MVNLNHSTNRSLKPDSIPPESRPESRLRARSIPSPTVTPVSPWSDSVQSVLDQPASSLPLKFALCGMTFFGVFLAWAWFGQVDEVAKAPGKIAPQDEAVQVQPVELGKVAQVAVKEGDTVQTGQVLLALESELDTQSVTHLQTVLMSQQSELNQTDVMMEKLRSQLETRSLIAKSDLQSHKATIDQNEKTAETQAALIRELKADSKAQQDRVERLRPLVEEGALPRDRIFDMEQALRERSRSLTESSGKLKQSQGDRDRLAAELERKQPEAALTTQQEIEQIRLRQTEIRGKMRETQSQIAMAQTKKDQRYVYAPASGKITTLHLKHRGQVVQPGQSIAEIAPQGKALILSTLLPSHEAGFVKPGMTTQIKFDAFAYQDFGVVPGKVLSVSPDSKTLEKGGQVYRVDIAIDRPSIRANGQTIELKTGQTGTAEIITRRRRILDLFLDPIRQLQGNISL
jgi:hemolysin D